MSADVPRETLAEALMSVLIRHTDLSTDAIDECVPVMLAVIPAANVPRETKPCACGGWSGAGSEFHHSGCTEIATIPDECAATGASCFYGPHGRNGQVQCRYCGAAAVPRETTMPDSIRALDLNLGGGGNGG